MGIKIKLRKKAISGNRQSLYLDFYPAIPHPETGEPTRREFLKLYLLDKPQSPLDRQHNKETMQLAESLMNKKYNELNAGAALTELQRNLIEKAAIEKENGERSFLDYFKAIANSKNESTRDNWISAYTYLESFSKGSLKFSELTVGLCESFREYVLKTPTNRSTKVTLSQNSASSYFSKFRATLRQALKDELLQKDLCAKVAPIKVADTQRNFLTIEELTALAKTECLIPIMKAASLFSAVTGLRFSDIEKLVWGEIEYIEGNGYFIRFRQKKTKQNETLPISDQAFSFLGERKNPTDRVFEGLDYSAYQNKRLYQWIGAAGITKDITFHCFRHTYATLQLSNGIDLYTVSKMLGHSDIRTTQVYAKVMDKAKREAANSITIEF